MFRGSEYRKPLLDMKSKKGKRKLLFIIIAVALLVVGSGFGIYFLTKEDEISNKAEDSELIIQTQEEASKENANEEENSLKEEDEFSEVEETIQGMSIEEKVGQLIITTPSALTEIEVVVTAGETTRKSLESYPIGGLIYSSESLETKEELIQMLTTIQLYVKEPLFLIAEQTMVDSLTEMEADSKSIGFNFEKEEDQYYSIDKEGKRVELADIVIQDVEEETEAIEALTTSNADMIFIGEDFKEVYHTLVNQVYQGEVAIEEIDSKLKRILEVKMKQTS